jgi:hypothetical protein
MNPFEWLKQITVEKREWSSFTEEEQSGFNSFIINKALSFNKNYIQIVEMAMLYPMPPDKLYDFYKDVIPKKPMWNKWVKPNTSWNDEELQLLATYFECGTREVKDFIEILSLEEKDVILLELKGFEGKKKNGKRKKSK